MATGNEPPKYPISSVDSALRLLLMIREQGSLRVSEAGRALGVGRSTAHRLLAMLQYRGFVQQDPVSRAYLAGPSLLGMSFTSLSQSELRAHARPYIEELRDAVQETAHIMVLWGRDAVFLDSAESARHIRAVGRVGSAIPAHCSAGGKVLLAELGERELRALYPTPRLAALTEESITARTDLEAELDHVREQGYATNHGESEADVRAIAAPVRDSLGRVIAALAISAPSHRVTDANEAAIAAIVTDCAARASIASATQPSAWSSTG